MSDSYTEINVKILTDGGELKGLDFKDDDGKDTEKLQEFVEKHALKHQTSNLGITYVVYMKEISIGYITIAASSIHKSNIHNETRPYTRSTPHFPGLIIANFAIDRPYREKGIGTKMLLWCIGKGRDVGKEIGCRYIILYARNAIGFYIKLGFRMSMIEKDDPFKLMYLDLFPEKRPQ